MPDSDPSHTASTDPRKEELATLFRQWDAADDGAGQRARVEVQGIWLRIGVTVALAVAAAVVMLMTASSFGFWTEPGAPRQLGNVRDQYVAGAESMGSPSGLLPESFGPANGHVALDGLVPTRPVAVADDPSAPEGATAYLFFCPLRRIVVFTHEPIVVGPNPAAAADPRLAKLVADGLALPEETAVSVAVQGRLLRGDQAPGELEPFVQSFAQRVQRSPDDLWVLIDGARPSDAKWAPIVWALAAAAPLLSLLFLVRAVRQRRAGARS